MVLDSPGRRGDGSPLWASDHYGVLAEISLAPAAAEPRRAPRAPAAAQR